MSEPWGSSWVRRFNNAQLWKAVLFLAAILAFLYLTGCAWIAPGRSPLCENVTVCAHEPSFPGHPEVRSAGFPPASTGRDTRLCDATARVECETGRDLWFDAERTGEAEFLVSVFVDDRTCKPFGELHFELVISDDPVREPVVEVGNAVKDGRAEGGESIFCGQITVVYPEAKVTGPMILDVIDTGPEAAKRPYTRVRFIWESSD